MYSPYTLPLITELSLSMVYQTSKPGGHADYQSLWDMTKKGTLTGVLTSSILRLPKYDACVLDKQTRTLVPKKHKEGEGHRAMRKPEKVWVDLLGPHAVRSHTGNKYVMDIVDNCTSFPWSIPLKTKDNTFLELKAWELAWESETGLKAEIYIMDNGELKSNEMETWLKSWGSTQCFTALHRSAHIGQVERMHRTLMAKACTMRLYANLPTYLWDKFYLTAVHVHARTTTCSLKGVTPWELWHRRKPDYSYMREISCHTFVLLPDKHNPKILERVIKCVLIGYELKSKAYRCYHRTTHKVYSSYHVPPPPLDMQPDNTDPNRDGSTTTPIPVLPHNDDEDEIVPPMPPDLDITVPPAPKALCHSPWVPIPTE
jgi:hypothetical protein